MRIFVLIIKMGGQLGGMEYFYQHGPVVIDFSCQPQRRPPQRDPAVTLWPKL